jgi:hypothetical protein
MVWESAMIFPALRPAFAEDFRAVIRFSQPKAVSVRMNHALKTDERQFLTYSKVGKFPMRFQDFSASNSAIYQPLKGEL